MRGRQDKSKAMYIVTMAKEKEEDEVNLKVTEVRDEDKEPRTEPH